MLLTISVDQSIHFPYSFFPDSSSHSWFSSALLSPLSSPCTTGVNPSNTPFSSAPSYVTSWYSTSRGWSTARRTRTATNPTTVTSTQLRTPSSPLELWARAFTITTIPSLRTMRPRSTAGRSTPRVCWLTSWPPLARSQTGSQCLNKSFRLVKTGQVMVLKGLMVSLVCSNLEAKICNLLFLFTLSLVVVSHCDG